MAGPDGADRPFVHGPEERRLRVAFTVEQSWHVVPGGIATATVELLRSLAKRQRIRAIGVAAWHRRAPRDDLVPPIAVRRLPIPRQVLYETWQLLRWPPVEWASGTVDVVHDLGYVAPPSRAPLVATVHDLFFLKHPEHYPWHSLLVLRRGFALARRHAAFVMCPSRATMEDCRDAGIEPERLRLVPWGFRPVDAPVSDGEQVRRVYGVRDPYVLFCGTVEPRKNLQRVLAAFAALDRDDVQLVIAGPGGWKEDIDEAVRRIRGRARRVGPVPRVDLQHLYRGAAAVVYPSLGEGFGLPVLEAMAEGAPVLTSAGTAMEEVAGDAAVLVDPLDVDAIAAGLDRLLEDRDLAERLGGAGRKRAAAYTWERSAERAEAVYAEAAGSAR